MKKASLAFILLFLVVLAGCTTLSLPTYYISGFVVDENSKPVSNAIVYLESVNSTYTDSQGYFIFNGVKQGTYNITIYKDGYHELRETLVVSSNLTSLQFVLNKIEKYTLTVEILDQETNSPLAASVSIKNTATQQSFGPKTGALITFTDIPEGEYMVTARADGYLEKTSIVNLTGNKTTRISLEPIKYYSLTVSCKDSYTKAAVTATVTLKDSSQIISQKTGSMVTFNEIPTGNYIIEATAPDYFNYTQEISINYSQSQSIELDRINYISGIVRDGNTLSPISNALVTIGSEKVYTNSSGEYSIGIRRGTYTISAAKEGYKTYESEISVTGSMTNQIIDLYPLSTVTISVISKTDGSSISGATVKLTNLSNNQLIGSQVGGVVTFYIPYFGNYRVDITHSDCYNYSETISVNIQDYQMTAELEWLPASASGYIGFGSVTPQTYMSLQSLKVKAKSFDKDSFSLMSTESSSSLNGILVMFDEFVSEENALESLRKVVGNALIEVHEYNMYVVKTTEIDTLIEQIRQVEGVLAVQPNSRYRLMTIPDDPQYISGPQWNLEVINMPLAWDYAKGEYSNTVIAVLDTGIRANVDLVDNIVPGYDVVGQDYDPYDDLTPYEYSHGTHMASIIAAITNNGQGLAGAGWNLKVMPIKVCSSFDGYVPTTEDVLLAEGIYKAVDMGADIINISLGDSQLPHPAGHEVMEAALNYAYNNGVAVFAAAGNDGRNEISYPASSPYTFSVGAVDYYGDRAPYSNYGSGLNIVAPGGYNDFDGLGEISDGIPGYSDSYFYSNTIEVWEGTSPATAQVSAVAGLMHSLGVTDPDSIYQILIDTATPKDDTYYYGAGLLNAGNALAKAANENQVSLSEARVFAGIITDSNTIEQITAKVVPTSNGYYTIENIPPYVDNVYIIGVIDFDGDNVIEQGEYFGMTSSGYTYSPDEDRIFVNFNIYKIIANDVNTAVTTSVTSLNFKDGVKIIEKQ